MLRRLAAPLSMLALASGLMAYWLAWQYTEHVVDRSLVDLANAVGQQIKLSGSNAPVIVPRVAEAMFSDPVEQLVYRITVDGTEVAGEPDLPYEGENPLLLRQVSLFDASYDSGEVRVAQLRLALPGGRNAVVEVGQRLKRRRKLAIEFLAAIMAPLLLLLVAGWGIVWQVVNRQLDPLTRLADSLNRRTHTSLDPVDETYVPTEIRPLTAALNALLGRLEMALDAQRKFIADAAHQLRTPLTALKLYAEQAARAQDPEKMRQAIDELRGSADRAVRLSNQLLSLARADPAEQAAHFIDVDLATLAFETGAEWVPRALVAGVDLGFARRDAGHTQPLAASSIDAPSAAPVALRQDDDALSEITEPLEASGPRERTLTVRGNPLLLREMLANLVDNALKYVPPHRAGDGKVTIFVGCSTLNAVELSVEDNGPGVPANVAADLFKRFFRGDAAGQLDGGSGGAGLGLAIVHDIAVLHGGSVRYADAAGGGSRFIVSLPLKV